MSRFSAVYKIKMMMLGTALPKVLPQPPKPKSHPTHFSVCITRFGLWEFEFTLYYLNAVSII